MELEIFEKALGEIMNIKEGASSLQDASRRMKEYGSLFGKTANTFESGADFSEKVNQCHKKAEALYNQGGTDRMNAVDKMFLRGTLAEKTGAIKATMQRLKGNSREALSDIVRNTGRGKAERACAQEMLETGEGVQKESITFFNLESMGELCDEIKKRKPLRAPDLAKWFEKGGKIHIEQIDGKEVWTYEDANGMRAAYIDGKIQFPPEAKHPIIGDISIGKFTGDRNLDKQIYLKKLEELYGLTEIPEGYALHHDVENGTMQLIRKDYHETFTHVGGYSIYKEM